MTKHQTQNVEQFEVTFYSPDGNKINDKPIPSTFSPKDDKTKPPTVDTPQIPSDKPVSRLEITIVNTTDGKSPKDVVLDIKACTEPTTGTTVSGGTRGTTVSGATPGTTISGQTTGTTTKRCEEIQALDESTARKIVVSPTDLSDDQKSSFQPISTQGVSFPSNELTPTITVSFAKGTEIQSITIPRNQIPGANVLQFEVTSYSEDGKKINEKPILSNASQKDDKTKPASLDYTQLPSNTPLSKLDIKVISTTDGQSPKGVVLDIKACSRSTTG